MKRVIVYIVLLLALASPTFAQTVVSPSYARTTGALSGAGSSALQLTTERMGTVGVEITGTWTGTVTFQVSNSGSSWTARNLTPPNSTTAASTATANGRWEGSVAGWRYFRVAVTTPGSGTLNLILNAVSTGGGGGGGGGGVGGGSVTLTDGVDTALVNAGGELLVTCSTCSGSGVSHIDDAAFAPATDDIVPIGGAFDDVAPDSINEGDAGIVRMSANRNLYSTIRDAAGNERGANVNASNQLAIAGPVTNAGTFAVQVDNTVTVASHAVTNAGTFAVQIDPGAVTSLGLLDNIVSVEDLVAGSGFSGIGFLAVRQDSQTALAADGDFIPPTIDANGGLRVSIVAGAGSGGTAIADDADFADGTTVGTPIGGVAEAASPSTVTEGDFGWAAITLNRALKVSLFTAAGAELTPATDVAEDAAESSGVTGPVVMGVFRAAAASSAGTTGDYATLNLDALGLLWTRQLDPCSGVAKTYIPINISTATTTELTSALAGASTNYYVCSINLVAAAAQTIAIAYDDTDGCGSVTGGMAGGTSAATGWSFAANGGIALGNGSSTVMKTGATNTVICAVTGQAAQISGTLVVVAAP